MPNPFPVAIELTEDEREELERARRRDDGSSARVAGPDCARAAEGPKNTEVAAPLGVTCIGGQVA